MFGADHGALVWQFQQLRKSFPRSIAAAINHSFNSLRTQSGTGTVRM